MRRYSNLTVSVVEEPRGRRGLPYKFIIQEQYGPHCAFYSRQGFIRWMRERNLRIGKRISDNHARIAGAYDVEAGWDLEAFTAALPHFQTVKTLSNGDYVPGIIQTLDGVPCIITLNCNVKDRQTLPYRETQNEIDPLRH